ncbi:hypothetical protein L1987_51468 [Smallanthus sonchifolius]|uniref:Uncharacterized protein n=1 Tax=Smallanthus sonchifolius TaxID=185202 RepID=A0ACB9EQC9_9ASTR|nr:hypothetical protein L1987_51468 [Smallanthus sonchifolius]
MDVAAAKRVLREHVRQSFGVQNDDILFASINRGTAEIVVNLVSASCRERWGESTCHKHPETSHACREEANNGYERVKQMFPERHMAGRIVAVLKDVFHKAKTHS